MFKFLSVFLVSMVVLMGQMSLASDAWLGNAKLYSTNRGNEYQTDLDWHSVIYKNIASYQNLTIAFEFYKKGVTETGDSVWAKVMAEAVLIDDATNNVIKSGYINVVGQNGNNAVYALRIEQFQPDTFGELPIELRDRKQWYTHLNFVMDGEIMFSVPLVFSYLP